MPIARPGPRVIPALLICTLFFMTGQAAEVTSESPDEAPFALERLTVNLDLSLTYDQEVILRIVRQGLKNKRSKLDEDRDVMICWFGQPKAFLWCARNGDIRAQRLRSRLPNDEELEGWDGYGTFQVTTFPVDRRAFKKTLAELPGSDDFDVEFISMLVAGERPPLEIPTDEELDRFATVWPSIGKPKQTGELTDETLTEIADAGFTENRYQHIARLIETYRSIEAELDSRLSNPN